MFRQTLLIYVGVSLILAISVLISERTRSTHPLSWVTQLIRFSQKDPFKGPHLKACHSEDVIPGEYTVILKHGYSLEQHMETIGTDLSSSIDWFSVAFEQSRLGSLYTANLDNATLAIVLRDPGVKLVECNRNIKMEPADI